MEPTTNNSNKSKVAIIVIVILVVAAIAIYMSLRPKTTDTLSPIANEEVQNGTPSLSDDSGILTQEITSATTFDNESDLSAIDKAF